MMQPFHALSLLRSPALPVQSSRTLLAGYNKMPSESLVTRIDSRNVQAEQPQPQLPAPITHDSAVGTTKAPAMSDSSLSSLSSIDDDGDTVGSACNSIVATTNITADIIKPGSWVEADEREQEDNDGNNYNRLLSPLERIRGRLHEKEERFKSLMKSSARSWRGFGPLDDVSTTSASHTSANYHPSIFWLKQIV